MQTQPYKLILIHEDAYNAALAAINGLDDGHEDEDVRALKDALDPLPEQDIFGNTPFVTDVELPVDG